HAPDLEGLRAPRVRAPHEKSVGADVEDLDVPREPDPANRPAPRIQNDPAYRIIGRQRVGADPDVAVPVRHPASIRGSRDPYRGRWRGRVGRGRPRTPARGRRRSPWSGRMSPRRAHPRGARRCPATDPREGNRRLPLSDRSRDMPRPLRARDGSRKSRSLTAGRKSEPRATNTNTICAIGEMNNCDNCILARHLPPPPDDRRSGVLHDRALASPGGHSSRKRRTTGVDGARPPRPTFRIARAAWRAAGPRSFGPPDHGRARTTRRGFAARAFPIPRGTLRLPDRVLRAAEGDPRRRLPPPATYRPEGCGSRRAPKGR